MTRYRKNCKIDRLMIGVARLSSRQEVIHSIRFRIQGEVIAMQGIEIETECSRTIVFPMHHHYFQEATLIQQVSLGIIL